MANQTRTVNPAVTERLQQLQVNMLRCRAIGHNLDFNGDGMFHPYERNSRGKILQVFRELICLRCGYQRTDVYDYPSKAGIGVLVKRMPKYPEGYLMTGGRLWRHDANDELIRRQGVVE